MSTLVDVLGGITKQVHYYLLDTRGVGMNQIGSGASIRVFIHDHH